MFLWPFRKKEDMAGKGLYVQMTLRFSLRRLLLNPQGDQREKTDYEESSMILDCLLTSMKEKMQIFVFLSVGATSLAFVVIV